MLKIGDILNLSNEELREKETGLRKELMQLRFQAKTGKLERQCAMKETKRSIARILTVISQRRIEDTAAVKSTAPAKKEKIAQVKKEKVEINKNLKKKVEAKTEKSSAKTAKVATSSSRKAKS